MRKRRSGRERRAEIINKISNSGDSKRGERPLFFVEKIVKTIDFFSLEDYYLIK